MGKLSSPSFANSSQILIFVPNFARNTIPGTHTNYYIKDEENITDSHHLIAHAEIYLKTNYFDQQEFWEWVKTYFVLRGFEWTDLEKGTLTDFPETNTILQMFSVKNVQMMEDKLGKDWWKE